MLLVAVHSVFGHALAGQLCVNNRKIIYIL